MIFVEKCHSQQQQQQQPRCEFRIQKSYCTSTEYHLSYISKRLIVTVRNKRGIWRTDKPGYNNNLPELSFRKCGYNKSVSAPPADACISVNDPHVPEKKISKHFPNIFLHVKLSSPLLAPSYPQGP